MVRIRLCLLVTVTACMASYTLFASESDTIDENAEVNASFLQIIPVIESSPNMKLTSVSFVFRNVGDKPLVIAAINGHLRSSDAWLYQNGKKIQDGGMCFYGLAPSIKEVRRLVPGDQARVQFWIEAKYDNLKPGVRYEIRVSHNNLPFAEELGLTPIRIHPRLVGYLDVPGKRVTKVLDEKATAEKSPLK